MVLVRPVVDAPEAVDAAVRDGAGAVEVAIGDVVPAWLAEAVERAHEHGLVVVARLDDARARRPGEAAGRQIGAVVAALSAGVDEVEGVDDRRVARVRTVLDAVARGSAPR